MFSSNRPSTRMTCGFKVNTNSPGWHKSMMKILKKIKGGNFAIDVDEGIAYVSGQGDPNKLLKLMGSKTGKSAEVAFVKTGGHYDPSFYHKGNYLNSYYGPGLPYNFSQGEMAYPTSYPYPPPAYCPPPPYHHQYPHSGYINYGYY